MLETQVHLVHERCAVMLETGEFGGHQSVTELEICADYYGAWESEEREMEAVRYAEGAWLRYAEGGWDTTGEYVWDSLRVPGGGFDPQAA